MATRKEARRRTLIQVSILSVAVVVIFAAVTLGLSWWRSQPTQDVSEVTITVEIAGSGTSIEVPPYLACELGTECGEGEELPVIDVSPGDDITIKLPKSIYDHDWQLVTIYDDPGANDQQLHGGYDTDTVTIPVSADPVGDSQERPQLVVIEVSSAMLGTDEDGKETAFATVWSVATQEPGGEDTENSTDG